jgi:hypothetical protein
MYQTLCKKLHIYTRHCAEFLTYSRYHTKQHNMQQMLILPKQPNYTIHTSQVATPNRALTPRVGRAIAQAVSRWLPGFETGSSCGILWWTKWRRGRFPPSSSVSRAKFIPPIAPKNHHHHQSIIGDMYNRPNGQTSMAAVPGPNRHLGIETKIPRDTGPSQTDRQPQQ